MAQLFISYARRDGVALASQLEADLRARGHAPWRDKREIGAGDSWSRVIEDAIQASEALVAVLTQGAYESAICRGEQLRALRLGRRIVPLLAQPGADRPVYLEAAHYLDFTDPASYPARLEELLAHLAAGGGLSMAQLGTRERAAIDADPALGAPIGAPGAGPADWGALQTAAGAQVARWRDTLAGRGRAPGVYEAGLYVARPAEEAELQRFAGGRRPGLLMVGEAGFGKTNLLAHWASQCEAGGDAVMVYAGERVDAQHLGGDIARDLGFEDAPALLPAWPRLQSMLQAEGRRLWIIVDGLNDSRDGRGEPHGPRALLTAVDALVSRLPGDAVRVIASCTRGTWQRMDRQERIALAWARWHPCGDAEALPIEPFDASQSAQAFGKLARRLELACDWDALPPSFQARLADPMLLRLLAESLQGRPPPEPGTDLDTLIFQRYWERNLGGRDAQALADALATEMLAQRSAAPTLGSLAAHPLLGPALADEAPDSPYARLLDDGVLVEVGAADLFDDTRLRFQHPKIGAYAIVRRLLRSGATRAAGADAPGAMPDTAVKVRELAAAADALPLAWEAAITLLTLRADAAVYLALACDADPELRELALEALVRHHAAQPAPVRSALAALLDSGVAEAQRVALRAAFAIGPAARELLLRAALSHREPLRRALLDTLYFIWTGTSRPEGEARASALYFVWRKAPDFTRALMQELAARIAWSRPREALRLFALLLELSITIYVNHCDRPEVVEQTAALFHEIAVDRLRLDRWAGAGVERAVAAVVRMAFAEQVLQWLMLDGQADGADFFSMRAGPREAVGRAARWIDPATVPAEAAVDLATLLVSPVPVLRGVGALVVAVHAVADADRAERAWRSLADAVDARGRAWLLAAYTLLLPSTPARWVPWLETLTARVESEGEPALLGFFDALYVPLGLAYAKRGEAMPLFDAVLDAAQPGSPRTARLLQALGVVGFYQPQAVLQWLRPRLGRLLADATTEAATLEALATVRTLHFEAVDAVLASAGADEVQRRRVAAGADPERVKRFMRLLGLYNNAVHYCVHYPRMRRGLGGRALELLATAADGRSFVGAYAAQAMAMAREADFDLRRWTQPDAPTTPVPPATGS